MKWNNIKSSDFPKVIRKLSLEQSNTKRRGDHPVYWYKFNGKKILRVTLPNEHGGSESMSSGFLQRIKKMFHLTTRQFEDLVECPLTANDFENILREKNLLD